MAQLAEQPEAVGDDVVLVDRLEVLLAGGDERVVAELGQPLDDAADHLAHAVLDEARPAVRLLDHRALVGALHQLVDLRRHRVLDDRRAAAARRCRCRSPRGSRRAACRARAGCASRPGPPRRSARSRPRRSRRPAAARASCAWTSVCAHGHAVMPCAVTPIEPPRAGLAGHGDAVQRVDLLREDAAVRRRLVLGVARLEVHLGAARALAVAHLLGDVLGQRLGAERALAEDHLADRVVDDLLEARHVRALLARAEVDEAVELGGEQRLVSARVDADDLLDVRHAHARERDVQRRDLVLDVLERIRPWNAR